MVHLVQFKKKICSFGLKILRTNPNEDQSKLTVLQSIISSLDSPYMPPKLVDWQLLSPFIAGLVRKPRHFGVHCASDSNKRFHRVFTKNFQKSILRAIRKIQSVFGIIKFSEEWGRKNEEDPVLPARLKNVTSNYN